MPAFHSTSYYQIFRKKAFHCRSVDDDWKGVAKKKKKKNTKKSRCFHYENNDCSTNYFSFDIFQSRRCAFLKSKRNGFWNSCIALCKSFIRSFLYSGWFFFLITGGVTCPGIVSHQRTQSLPLAHPAPLTDHTSHPPRAAKRSNQSSKCMYHLAFNVYACACVFIIRSNTCQFHSWHVNI